MSTRDGRPEVLRWLAEGDADEVSTREVHKRFQDQPQWCRTAEDARRVLYDLAELGWLEGPVRVTGPRGGRPSERWTVAAATRLRYMQQSGTAPEALPPANRPGCGRGRSPCRPVTRNAPAAAASGGMRALYWLDPARTELALCKLCGWRHLVMSEAAPESPQRGT